MTKKTKPTLSTKPAAKAPAKPKAVAAIPPPPAPIPAPAVLEVKSPKPPAAKAKPAAKPVPAKPVAAKASSGKRTVYADSDVALRAYFISEKRRAHGLPGDEHQDWIEAERQVKAESSRKRTAKKA